MAKTSLAVEDELARRLLSGLDAFSRQMRLIALPRGMTRERFGILALIEKHGPVSVTELAARASVKPATMSRMTAALVEDGLARKGSDRTDGRGVSISLTVKGRRVSRAASRKSIGHVRHALSDLSDGEVEVLLQLVRKLEAFASGKR